MGIRDYLALLRRQWWVVLAVMLVVVASTAAFYAVRTPTYEGTATAVVLPDDPAERFLNPPAPGQVDEQEVEAQAAFASSIPVAATAAKRLGNVDPAWLLDRISVEVDSETALIRIGVRDRDPARARDMTNAVAEAFVENRRQAAVANLKRVTDELGRQLEDLQRQITFLDAQIGDRARPSPVPGQVDPASVGPPGTPRAARYAAAVRYQQVFDRQQLLLIEQSLRSGGAELVSGAALPLRPVGPGLLQSGAVAALVGLVLGFGLAFLRDHLDDRIRERDEAQAETGLPVLAELPKIQEDGGLAAATWPNGALAEAVRGLRTSLEHLDPNPLGRLVVTSPGRRDGKSFVAANLGVVFAQAGYRTVLVSSDLRRPTLEGVLGTNGTKGLTTLVDIEGLRPAAPGSTPASAGERGDGARRSDGLGQPHENELQVSVSTLLVRTQIDNLCLLPCGPLPSNPAELLNSTTMAETLDELGRLADVVILDTPPVLAVTDASILATEADGVVLVATPGQTTRAALQRARATLAAANARLLGIVLNRVQRTTSENEDYYSYSSSHPVTAEDGSQSTDDRADGGRQRRWLASRRARNSRQ